MRVRTATETVYLLIGLSVYSRADFIVTPDGTDVYKRQLLGKGLCRERAERGSGVRRQHGGGGSLPCRRFDYAQRGGGRSEPAAPRDGC